MMPSVKGCYSLSMIEEKMRAKYEVGQTARLAVCCYDDAFGAEKKHYRYKDCVIIGLYRHVMTVKWFCKKTGIWLTQSLKYQDVKEELRT